MSFSRKILGCIIPSGEDSTPTLEDVSMNTKHCGFPLIIPGNSPPKDGALVPEQLRTTHFLYVGDEHASQRLYHRLPELQPSKEPFRWSSTAWKERFVCGNNHYHLFCTAEKDNEVGCILKVADQKDYEGGWLYEDFDLLKPEKVADHVEALKSELRTQMENARLIPRPGEN